MSSFSDPSKLKDVFFLPFGTAGAFFAVLTTAFFLGMAATDLGAFATGFFLMKERKSS